VAVHQRPAQVGGLRLAEAGGKPAQCGQVPHEVGRAGHAVPGQLREVPGSVGIPVGRGVQYRAERCHPGHDPDDRPRPQGHHFPWIVFCQDRLDRRAVSEGDRLVIADDRPLKGQLEQYGLASGHVEDGAPADVRRLSDRVDRRGRVAPGDKQVVGGGDDRPPGAPGLLVAHLRGVAPGWLAHRAAAGILTVLQIRCTIDAINASSVYRIQRMG
jgi:hypothetical protein